MATSVVPVVRLSRCVLLTLAACQPTPRPASPSVPAASLHAAKMPAPPVAPTAPAAVEDTAPAPTASPPAWVELAAPPFVDETPMHGGPDWHLASSRLPAVSAALDRVAILEALDTSLVGTPSARVVELAAPGARVLATTPLLGTEEFHQPKQEPDPAAAYAKLAGDVKARVATANAALESGGWTSMIACKLDEEPYSREPPCSMAVQHMDCDGVAISYRAETLTAKTGARAHVQRFPSWKPTPYKADTGPIPVAACFGALYIDSSHHVLAGPLLYMCQGGGDWCSIAPVWRVVTL